MATNGAKLERFERLAEKRITEAIRRLRLIGNLSNRHNYSYTDEHVRQIFEALETEMRALRQRFTEQGKGSDASFRFRRAK